MMRIPIITARRELREIKRWFTDWVDTGEVRHDDSGLDRLDSGVEIYAGWLSVDEMPDSIKALLA